MKLIITLIPPHRLDDVREALLDAGIAGLTVQCVRGCGSPGGNAWMMVMAGDQHRLPVLREMHRLEVLAEDEQLDRLIETLMKTLQTPPCSDNGKIFVCEPDQAYRVRTEEYGVEAIR